MVSPNSTVSSCIAPQKVDSKWVTGSISCKKHGITCITSYFITDLGSFKCYLGTFITNVQLFYISALDWHDNAETSLQNKWLFSTKWHQKQEKKKKIEKDFQIFNIKCSKVVCTFYKVSENCTIKNK